MLPLYKWQGRGIMSSAQPWLRRIESSSQRLAFSALWNHFLANTKKHIVPCFDYFQMALFEENREKWI